MADNTIAFSHRGGYWKTRYTFFSSCYAFIDRCFISFAKSFTQNAVWKHDSDSVGRTNFYGTQGGSGIAVTFNKNPSQNKLYKAFSLESTNNVNGVTIFDVNNSSVAEQTKRVEAGVLTERGGIMYGHIGRQTIAMGANTNIVGEILNGVITDLTPAPSAGFGSALLVDYTLSFIDGAQNNIVFSGADFPSKLFMYSPQAEDGNYFYGYTTEPVGPGEFSSYSAMGGNIVPISLDGNVLTLLINFSTPDAYNEYIDKFVTEDLPDPATNFYLYSVSAESINGEDPKGQTADAVITLGSAPYELYALNVEYSPTDYDHDK